MHLCIRTETQKVEQTKLGETLHMASVGQAQCPALGEREARWRSLVPGACLGFIKGMSGPQQEGKNGDREAVRS